MSDYTKKHTASARIIRTMGLFSGMKGLGLLCSLIRNKLIAWLIGPTGIGLVTLFNSVVDLVGSTTRLSMDQSVQRNISQAGASDINATLKVTRRWALWLGTLGTIVMCAMSPLLSFWTFDTTERWPTFCILSVVPFLLTYSSCVTAENQGLQRFKAVAMANVIAAVAGLAVVVPLIVWLRIDSILWIVVAYGVTSWLGSFVFRPRIDKSTRIDIKETFRRGRDFIRLGGFITLGVGFAQVLNYFFILYLNTFSSTEVLGLYQSGYTMMNSYVGIIFSALWIEYYPRLSASAHSPYRLSLAASHEARVTLTLIAPLLCLLIILINPIIRLIYSDQFLPVVPYVVLASVGIMFKLMSWCLSYVILAKGSGKIFLVSEIVSGIVGLGLNIAGFELGGLFGLGLAYIIWYILYAAAMMIVCRRYYKVGYDAKTIVTSIGAIVLVSLVAVFYLTFFV